MAKLVDIGGTTYSMPDDATDDDIRKFAEKMLPKTQSWSNVASTFGRQLQTEMLKKQEGFAQIGNEFIVKPAQRVMESLQNPVEAIKGTLPEPKGSAFADEQTRKRKAAEKLLKEETDGPASTLQQIVSSAGLSLAQNIPDAMMGGVLARGLVTAGKPIAEALGTAAKAAIGSMSVREGAGEFADQKEAGNNPLVGLGAATVTTLSEAIPETWGTMKLIDVLTNKTKVGKGIVEFLFRDLYGEELTQASEFLTRKMTREPNLTLDDFVHEAIVTAGSTAISGPVQGGIGKAIYTAALHDKAGEIPDEKPSDAKPTVAPQQPQQEVEEEVNVEGKTNYINDNSLPIVGSPEDTQTTPRIMPEIAIERLRQAYKKLGEFNFLTTPEDKIRAKGDFKAAKEEVENILKFDPNARELIRQGDLKLGIQFPDVSTVIENQIDELVALTPEEVLRKQVARESGDETTGFVPLISEEVAQALNLDSTAFGVMDPLSAKQEARRASNADLNTQIQPLKVEIASRPELIGKTWKEISGELRPGEIAYISSGKTDINGFAGSFAFRLAETLQKTFLPTKRIIVLERPTENDKHFSKAFAFDENTLGFLLPKTVDSKFTRGFDAVRNVATFSDSMLKAMETTLHEFTHMVHMAHWESSPFTEQLAVAKEYHADLRKVSGLDGDISIKDAYELLYAPETVARLLIDAKLKGFAETDSFVSAEARANLHVYQKADYWFNFNEWMAHKGLKYFTKRAGVSRENVGFFRKLIQKLYQLYKDSFAKYFSTAHPSFEKWLDNVARRESGIFDGMYTEQLEKLKQDLLADKVPSVIVNQLTKVTPSSDAEIEAIRRKASEYIATLKVDGEATSKLFTSLSKIKSANSLAEVRKLFGKEVTPTIDALLHHPAFANDATFSGIKFLNAVAQEYVPASSMAIAEDASSMEFFFSMGNRPQDNLSTYFDRKTRKLTFVGDTDNKEVVILANLREIAQRTGVARFRTSDTVTRTLFKDFATGGGWFEMPYFSFEPKLNINEASELAQVSMPDSMHAIGRKLGNFFGMSSANALGRYNWLYEKVLDAFKLIKMNENVPGMKEERQALRNRMIYRHKWIRSSDETLATWLDKIPKDQAAVLSKLLFSEAEQKKSVATVQADPNKPGHYIYTLPQRTISSLRLAPATVELYSKIRNDFHRFADEWNKVGLWELSRSELSSVAQETLAEAMRKDMTMADYLQLFNVFVNQVTAPSVKARVQQRASELNAQFNELTKKPYMPYTRFGRYGVLVLDAQTKQTKYFEGFDTEAQANKARVELSRQFRHDSVSTTYLEDVPYELAGMPPALLDAMEKTLGLSQQQKEAFSEILLKLSHSNSFAHRLAHRSGVEGYSVDAVRAYADYFRKGASYLARVRSNPELSDALRILEQYIRRQTERGGVDVSRLGRLHEYFVRHHTFLNDSGNEHGEVKSFVALWHFGFNAMTALWNLTQVPFVTLPYMMERHGAAKAAKALTKAYADLPKIWAKNGGALPADEEAMLEYALDAGFRDQSQATVLAQVADGGALSRAGAVGWWQKHMNGFNHAAMWMFSKGEGINRDVTLLAEYRLNKGTYHGDFDRNSFDIARDTVEQTHNEYGLENRPEITRGFKGIIFQFMHYPLTMLFLMLGGDKSWWRILLVQAVFAGALGLPLAGDTLNAAKFLGRRVFGKDFDLDAEARKYLEDMDINSRLIMRGVTSNLFGFDLSQRMSLGEIVPGMRSLGSHQSFEKTMSTAVGDSAGPAASLVLNLMSFIASDNKTSWATVRKILPSAARQLGDGAHAFTTGAIKDRAGAVLYEPDVYASLGLSLGAQPTELKERYAARSRQYELGYYWNGRRQNLMDIFSDIVINRADDREAMKDFTDRLQDFNSSIPDPGLRITGSQLRQSVKRRVQSNALKEAGLGTDRKMMGINSEITDTYVR